MLSQDDLDKMQHRAEQMATGYGTGNASQLYAKDVMALLADLKVALLVGKSLDLDFRDTIKRLQQQVEITDLWKRDCEAAQMRVAELERREGVNGSRVGRWVGPDIESEVPIVPQLTDKEQPSTLSTR